MHAGTGMQFVRLHGTVDRRGGQVGTQKAEEHLPLSLQTCTSTGCTTAQKAVTMDANWRWTHSAQPGSYTNCYTGTEWDSKFCPDPATCAESCALDGVPASDCASIYGVSSDGQGIKLNFKTGSNIGSRMYMLEDEDTYLQFKLKNRESARDLA